ncbi:MAG: TerC family protein [Betaproteobacteria bacterium]|nr:TerC family protein [Betaproteobacteria bacterium]
MEMLAGTQFWVSLAQIIGIDIILSGDNAVVIALATRSLPLLQQRKAILFGSMAAVAMRVTLAAVAVEMLTLPYLKMIGSVLLLWIGIQLLLPDDHGESQGENGKKSNGNSLPAAIRTILVADLVMSLDNVIGIAAAAKGNLVLLVMGLAISIPLIVFSSTAILKLMDRFPVIITLGAALLGYVAGEMLVTDPALAHWMESQISLLHQAAPIAGAVVVVLAGKALGRRAAARKT